MAKISSRKTELTSAQKINKGLKISQKTGFLKDRTNNRSVLEKNNEANAAGLAAVSPMVSYVDEKVLELKNTLDTQLQQLNTTVNDNYGYLNDRISIARDSYLPTAEELRGSRFVTNFWVVVVGLVAVAALGIAIFK